MHTRNEIVPGLFIGNAPPPGKYPVDVIVLAAEEYQPAAEEFPGCSILHAPLDDDPSRPMTASEIATAARAGRHVARCLRDGKIVLSTCLMGLNRSSLVAAISMSYVYGLSAGEIIKRIRAGRGPNAMSNPNFELLLRALVNMRAKKARCA